MQFPILFADADFCCGMDTPEKAKNVSGWLPGRAQNRGAFQFFEILLENETKQKEKKKECNKRIPKREMRKNTQKIAIIKKYT